MQPSGSTALARGLSSRSLEINQQSLFSFFFGHELNHLEDAAKGEEVEEAAVTVPEAEESSVSAHIDCWNS